MGRTRKNQEIIAQRVSAKICDGDVKGAVRIASSTESLAPYNSDTIKKLKELHPAGSSHPDDSVDNTNWSTLQIMTVTQSEVIRAVQRFPPGSAGGPSGLRPQHLKDLTSPSVGEPGTRLGASLTKLANLVLSGKVHDSVRPFFFGASLSAFSKATGGVRPIACGNRLRRVVAKAACSKVSDLVGGYLRPLQLGFGTKLGSEAAVHSIRRYCRAKEGKGEVLLKVDFRNAFNTVSRHEVLKQVLAVAPSLYPLVWSSYAVQSHLYYRDQVILSQEGVQQGDPLGPVLFGLALHPLVKACCSTLNVWYLDDGTLGGDPTKVLECFRQIVTEGPKIGLVVNPRKCELIPIGETESKSSASLSAFQEVAPGILAVDQEDCLILGSPLFSNGVEVVLRDKLLSFEKLEERICMLDPHDALFLLRHCFGIPRLLYTLRSAPCFLKPDFLKLFDLKLRFMLEKVLNVQLDCKSWEQASLPVRFGGLGVRSALGLSLPAYLASAYQCSGLSGTILGGIGGDEDVEAREGRDLWRKKGLKWPRHEGVQRDWDDCISRQSLAKLIAACETNRESKARILAVSSRGAGDWLNACPVPSLGLKLNPMEVRISVSLRLGIELCKPHECICGTSVESTGWHGLSCGKSKGRWVRDAMVNDLIKRGLTSAGFPSMLEPSGVARSDGKRPDGLTMVPWSKGRCVIWDFTCRDTLAPSHVKQASVKPGRVASEGENRKRCKYADLSDRYIVVPICVETFGAWGAESFRFIRELGKKIQESTGEIRSTAYLRQSIGIAIQRGNAISVMGTIPEDKDLDEIYYL